MFRLKISGNFFLILNDPSLTENSRHPCKDVTYQVYDELEADPKIRFRGLTSRFNSKYREKSIYLFSELLDDSTGLAFVSLIALKDFLDDNTGKSSASGNGAALGSLAFTFGARKLSKGVDTRFGYPGGWQDKDASTAADDEHSYSAPWDYEITEISYQTELDAGEANGNIITFQVNVSGVALLGAKLDQDSSIQTGVATVSVNGNAEDRISLASIIATDIGKDLTDWSVTIYLKRR